MDEQFTIIPRPPVAYLEHESLARALERAKEWVPRVNIVERDVDGDYAVTVRISRQLLRYCEDIQTVLDGTVNLVRRHLFAARIEGKFR